MRRIWKFISVKSNREILSLIGAAIAALTSGIWIVFVYLHPNVKAEDGEDSRTLLQAPRTLVSMEECQSADTHPDAAEILNRIRGRFEEAPLVYGWKGGAANSGDADTESVFPISNLIFDNGELTIHYNWQGGRMHLTPVVPKYGSVRAGIFLQGSWLQSNGSGCVEFFTDEVLSFGKNNEALAIGWWFPSNESSRKLSSFIRSQASEDN